MTDSDNISISDLTFHPFGDVEREAVAAEWLYPNGYRSNLLGQQKLNAMYEEIQNLPESFGFTKGGRGVTVRRHGASGWIPKVHKRLVNPINGPDSVLIDDGDRGYLYIFTDAHEMGQIKQSLESNMNGGGGKKRKSKRKKNKSHKRKSKKRKSKKRKSHKRKSKKRKSRRIRRR